MAPPALARAHGLLRLLAVMTGLSWGALAFAQPARVFPTPEAAVEALASAVKATDIEPIVALLGAEGRELAAGTDPATARQHRDVFVIAMREGWKLEGSSRKKELIVGREAWPFPIPIVKGAQGWSFDAAAGREEVLTRRIGRNELAAIRIVGTYVAAQHAYARRGHDGKSAGVFARRFVSSPGTQDGLYWPAVPGQPSSPLGSLVAEAAAEGRPIGDGQRGPVPFHGYYFRILEQQGAAATGGARGYVVDGAMTGGFGLVAWPALYGSTGIMTFMVGPDGIVRERDFGDDTATEVAKVTAFNPDRHWDRVFVPGAP